MISFKMLRSITFLTLTFFACSLNGFTIDSIVTNDKYTKWVNHTVHVIDSINQSNKDNPVFFFDLRKEYGVPCAFTDGSSVNSKIQNYNSSTNNKITFYGLVFREKLSDYLDNVYLDFLLSSASSKSGVSVKNIKKLHEEINNKILSQFSSDVSQKAKLSINSSFVIMQVYNMDVNYQTKWGMVSGYYFDARLSNNFKNDYYTRCNQARQFVEIPKSQFCEAIEQDLTEKVYILNKITSNYLQADNFNISTNPGIQALKNNINSNRQNISSLNENSIKSFNYFICSNEILPLSNSADNISNYISSNEQANLNERLAFMNKKTGIEFYSLYLSSSVGPLNEDEWNTRANDIFNYLGLGNKSVLNICFRYRNADNVVYYANFLQHGSDISFNQYTEQPSLPFVPAIQSLASQKKFTDVAAGIYAGIAKPYNEYRYFINLRGYVYCKEIKYSKVSGFDAIDKVSLYFDKNLEVFLDRYNSFSEKEAALDNNDFFPAQMIDFVHDDFNGGEKELREYFVEANHLGFIIAQVTTGRYSQLNKNTEGTGDYKYRNQPYINESVLKLTIEKLGLITTFTRAGIVFDGIYSAILLNEGKYGESMLYIAGTGLSIMNDDVLIKAFKEARKIGRGLSIITNATDLAIVNFIKNKNLIGTPIAVLLSSTSKVDVYNRVLSWEDDLIQALNRKITSYPSLSNEIIARTDLLDHFKQMETVWWAKYILRRMSFSDELPTNFSRMVDETEVTYQGRRVKLENTQLGEIGSMPIGNVFDEEMELLVKSCWLRGDFTEMKLSSEVLEKLRQLKADGYELFVKPKVKINGKSPEPDLLFIPKGRRGYNFDATIYIDNKYFHQVDFTTPQKAITGAFSQTAPFAEVELVKDLYDLNNNLVLRSGQKIKINKVEVFTVNDNLELVNINKLP